MKGTSKYFLHRSAGRGFDTNEIIDLVIYIKTLKEKSIYFAAK
jgi:hypothetical protein